MHTGAVIAAAEMSSRMVQFRELMKVGNRTMTERVIVNFKQAGVQEIVLVAGHRFEQLEKELRGFGVTFLENRNYENTQMFESAKIGLEYLKDKCERIFFCPADIPFFLAKTVETMLACDADVVQPVYGERAGHPVLIRACLIPRILEYTGDSGLKGALRSMEGLKRRRVAVDDEAVLMNAHTREALQRLVDMHNASLMRPAADVVLISQKPFFNRTAAGLLHEIAQKGSVREACEAMGISYSKGWSIIQDAEDGIGCRIVERKQGGKNGGGAGLTGRGVRMAELFGIYEKRVQQAAEDIFRDIFLESDLF